MGDFFLICTPPDELPSAPLAAGLSFGPCRRSFWTLGGCPWREKTVLPSLLQVVEPPGHLG
jgi:hypothetical protein